MSLDKDFAAHVNEHICSLTERMKKEGDKIHPGWHADFFITKVYQRGGHKYIFFLFKNKICKKNNCKQKFKHLYNLFIQELDSMYNDFFFALIENVHSLIEPNLNSLNEENLTLLKEFILITFKFLNILPIIKTHLNDKSLSFLKNILLANTVCKKYLLNVIKPIILMIMMHFRPNLVITDELYQTMLNIFLKLIYPIDSLIFYINYFKDFKLLFQTVFCNINEKPNLNENFIKVTNWFLKLNIDLLNKNNIENLSDERKFAMHVDVLEIMFKNENKTWRLKDLSKTSANFLVNTLRQLMKHTKYLTKKTYRTLLKSLCSIINKEISYFYKTRSGSNYFFDYEEVSFSIGGILLNENIELLLELIYFLDINNLKSMINAEVIDKIVTFNLIWTENIPEKYLDSITFQMMDNPVQLLPSPETVDYSTYVKFHSTTGLNPFTRGKLTLHHCPDLKNEISQWRKSTSFSLDETRNSYIGKFLHYYDEVENLSELFENNLLPICYYL